MKLRILLTLVVVVLINLLILSNNAFAMEQMIVGGRDDALSSSTDEYNTLLGGTMWDSTALYVYEVISAPGEISDLSVELSTNPGTSTDAYTITLVVNGTPSALTVTFGAADTQKTDTTHSVSVVAGDYVYLKSTRTSTPDNTPTAIWSCVFTGTTASESQLMAGASQTTNSDTRYHPITGASYLSYTTEAIVYQISPAPGTIRDLYVQLDFDPGTNPDAYRVTLMKNSIAQSLTCTITADNITCNDVANTVVVAAGDLLSWRIEPLETPSVSPYLSISATFVANVDGSSLILGSSSDGPTAAATEYNFLQTNYISSPWITEKYQGSQLGFTIKNLYTKIAADPGAGKDYVMTIRENGGATGITTTMTGATTFSVTRVPTSDENETGVWTNGWDAVNEDSTNLNDTDYIIGETDPGHFSMNFTAFTIPSTATITDLIIYYRVMNTAHNACNIGSCIKVGTTYHSIADTAADPGVDPPDHDVGIATYHYHFTQNPATVATWTYDEINGTDGTTAHRLNAFGIASNDLAPDVNIYAVWAECNYTMPAILTASDTTHTFDTDSYGELGISVTITAAATSRQLYWGCVCYKEPVNYDLQAISPSSKDFGFVVPSTTYWSIGHTPDNPIDDAHCTFTLTNNGIQCDVDVHSHNFTGGGGWTLGNPTGATTARLSIGKSGDNPASPTVLTTSDQEIYDALAVSGHFHFDIRLETPTSAFPDGTQRTTQITFTAVAED